MIKYDDGNYELNEAYRSIRTYILVDESIKTILITSSDEDEGKSTCVANIGRCFSEIEDKKTLIIDCDFRKKDINKQFEISRNTPGLSNIIYNGLTLNECIKTDGKLDILTSGTVNCNPSVLLELERTKKFINSLRNKYDYIIIDSPPVMRVNDACIIAQYVDGTVIVSASTEIDKHEVKATKDRLEKINANFIGVILNKFKTKGNNIYAYYGYDDEQSKKRGLFKRKKKKFKYVASI